MDSTINTAARALAAGDPLGALDLVALREDPPGLALRGVAMAQLGELSRARALLREAGRAFDAEAQPDPLAKARCVTAQIEVELALRELSGEAPELDEAIAVLERCGDAANAVHARLLAVRRLLVLGRVDEAELRAQAQTQTQTQTGPWALGPGVPPMLEAIAQLAAAEIATRRVQARAAAAALCAAQDAAARAGIPALLAEVQGARARLASPAARLLASEGQLRPLTLAEVEDVLASGALVVSACRRELRRHGDVRSLASRPVLFALARALASAFPHDLARERLLAQVFDASASNDSWRGRLRVEVGRLRLLLDGLATIEATPRGYALRAADRADVVVLLPPVDGDNASVLALMADGARWSSSALALALGVSQRSIQRSLAALLDAGRVEAFGRGRARRWLAPIPGDAYATALLLPDFRGGR